MTKSLKHSIGITFILALISTLSGGGITLSMAVFSGEFYSTVVSFLFYILLFFVVLIYGSSNVIFKLPCKKILRALFWALWLIFYSALSYCLLCMWIFLGFKFPDICWNINASSSVCDRNSYRFFAWNFRKLIYFQFEVLTISEAYPLAVFSLLNNRCNSGLFQFRSVFLFFLRISGTNRRRTKKKKFLLQCVLCTQKNRVSGNC